VKDGDRISYMEEILEYKALQWHQACAQQFSILDVPDTWTAYWETADAPFWNEREPPEASQQMRDLRDNGDISVYLVTLKDPNRCINSACQAFRD
jgi:hypothetical protein